MGLASCLKAILRASPTEHTLVRLADEGLDANSVAKAVSSRSGDARLVRAARPTA